MKKVTIIIASILALIGFVWILQPQPCTESLDYYPNLPDHGNFGQPILTQHNCSAGEVPINWRDFEPSNQTIKFQGQAQPALGLEAVVDSSKHLQ